ncbi:hypothetical protein EW145_g3959 [Phellinidium pouzarii]|uniref:Cytochrome P450 n=1 Tax=Phellinidium pouzarii TaxID=167371 RepID=A0A4S4L5R0_9AGAM|nr:hypothetical protein EW145_g3959 [Phellinidium pouzarii]
MAFNGTAFVALDVLDPMAWSDYAPSSVESTFGPGVILLGIVSLPLIIISLHAAIFPKDTSLSPEIFYWLPFIGSAIQYGDDPIGFLTRYREKYGDVLTFVLLGRKMIVALGQKGNNFVTGGKLAHMSTQEALPPLEPLTTPCFGKDVVYDVPNAVFMEQKRFVKAGLSLENFRAYISMMEDEISMFLAHDASFRAYQVNPTSEKDAAWGQFHALQTHEETRALPLLDAVIRETLRHAPANPQHHAQSHIRHPRTTVSRYASL